MTTVPRTVDFHPIHGLPGTITKAPVYRLYANLLIVEPHADTHDLSDFETNEYARRVDAVVDTGSGISVFAYQTWKPFEWEMRWPKDR